MIYYYKNINNLFSEIIGSKTLLNDPNWELVEILGTTYSFWDEKSQQWI
jgi:hypothetical protein